MSNVAQLSRFSRVRDKPCFFLFIALLALVVALPFLAATLTGRALAGLLNVFVLLTAAVAIGRTRLQVIVAVLLGLPTLGLQILALWTGSAAYFALFWGAGAVFYAFIIAHLLHYVLHRETMTGDKLYGAVAAYFMIGLFWAFVFGVLQHFYPGAFSYQGTVKTMDLGDLFFFSFAVLTTAGFGDITPVVLQTRVPTILEAIMGVMYVAILIARLTGVYPVIRTPDA